MAAAVVVSIACIVAEHDTLTSTVAVHFADVKNAS